MGLEREEGSLPRGLLASRGMVIKLRGRDMHVDKDGFDLMCYVRSVTICTVCY